MNISDPFYRFDTIPQLPTVEGVPLDPLSMSLEAAWNLFRRVENWAEVETFMSFGSLNGDVFIILRSIFCRIIDEQRFFRWENCSSINDFCSKQRSGVFAISPPTLSDDLKCAHTLRSISSSRYEYHNSKYLESEGRAAGRGYFGPESMFPVFRIVDFAGHKSKLSWLGRLLDGESEEIDWHEFFNDGFDQYEHYVRDLLKKKEDEKRKKKGGAIASMPQDLSDDLGKPFTAAPQNAAMDIPTPQYDQPIGELDPFASRDGESHWVPISEMMQELHFSLASMPSGSLANNPIFADTRLYSDPAFPARALKYLINPPKE